MKDNAIIEKMKQEGLSSALITDFLSKVEKVRNGDTGKVIWSTIGDLDPEKDEVSLDVLKKTITPSTESLKKLVVIKLNGGLGTSMGLSQAKSLIKIKNNKSFLEIIADQIRYFRKKYSVDIQRNSVQLVRHKFQFRQHALEEAQWNPVC